MSYTSLPADLQSPLIPTPPNTKQEKVCIDDMLQKYCGEFGRWQLKHFVLTSLAWTLEALHTMVMIFADREPEWRCLGGDDVNCLSSVGGVCGLEPGSWEWIGGSGSSTVAEWGLVCDQKYKVGLVQALFFAGCLVDHRVEVTQFQLGVKKAPMGRKRENGVIRLFLLFLVGIIMQVLFFYDSGAGTFGHLSDSFLGRKGSLTIVCILNGIFGCLTALSPNFWIYAFLRLLTGFSTGGVGLCAFVLATEPVGPTKRGAAGMSTFYFFSSGIAMLSGIAYLFQTWRALYIATSIPSILFLIVLPFLPDSPRWYLVRGKITQAMDIMRSIAKANGRPLNESITLALDEEVYDHEQNGTKEAITCSLVDVLRSPITRTRLIISIAINFLCSLVYYGLSLNVANLGTNLYLSVFLNAVAEMPAFLLTAILIDRLGRRTLTIGTLWFSGIFCLLGSLIRKNGAWKAVRMVCGVLGIFGMAGTYNLLFIYTLELFPTVVRNAALGCTTQGSQTGAILSPFVVVLGNGLPFVVFGMCGFVGGLLAFYLPETSNKPLYDTMDGMEEGEKTSGNA